jgi:hypothetical protein
MSDINDERLRQFLKVHHPQAPAAPPQELKNIIAKMSEAAPVTKSFWQRPRFRAFALSAMGSVAASLFAVWIGAQTAEVDKASGNQSAEWAVKLVSAEMNDDEGLPTTDIGEEYLSMAENSVKQKEF